MIRLEQTENAAAWIQRGFVLAALLACGIALSENTPDPDLWGHVRYAQDALEVGHLNHTATHTFTATGYRWINHEILSEFTLAAVYGLVGPRGLVFAKTLLGCLVIGLMLNASFRRGVSLPVSCICALLVALTLAAFWSVRPQLASFVLLAISIVVLDHAFAKWNNDREIRFAWLCAIPPLLAVWTNSHGGFAAGLCLVSAYLGVRALELFWQQRSEADTMVSGIAHIKSVATSKTFLQLLCLGLACWLFTLLNPYGIQLHAWLAESLRVPRPEITEWAAPCIQDEFFVPFVALSALVIVALLGTVRRRDPAQLALLVLCFWQATSHSRHIALFAILVGFWIPEHVDSLLSRLRSRGTAKEAGTRKDAPGTMPDKMGVVFGVVLVCVFGLLSTKLYNRISDFPVAKDEYPVAALQYISDHDLTGRLVVSFDWAQYALAALSPDVQVQFDGRFRTCYPQEVIDMHFDFLLGDVAEARHRSKETGPVDGTRVLRHHDPNIVLIDRRFPHSVGVMEDQQEEFSLLYQDAMAQVWGRREFYDDPTKSTFVSQPSRSITNEPQEGSVLWPAFPVSRPSKAVASLEGAVKRNGLQAKLGDSVD